MISCDEIKKIFGKVVSELRQQKGYTQEQLAEYLGISPHTVTRIETGNTFVSCEKISKICNLFKISPNVLFTPTPHLLFDEKINYIEEITNLLPSIKSERLKELFNFIVIMNK